MNMEADLEDFKKKQQPALVGTSIRNDSSATETAPATAAEKKPGSINTDNGSTKSKSKTARSRSSSRPAVINSRVSISNDYVSVAELKSEGGLLADEEGELLEDILDHEGHLKDDALQVTEQIKELDKMKKDTKNKIVKLSSEDKLNLANEQQVFGGDSGKFVAPAAAMSKELSGFHYDSPTPSKRAATEEQHEIIKAEDVETLDEILNKVNQGQATKPKADDLPSSSKKEINIKEPVIPDSAIEVDSEKTAPASMREGSSSRLLEKQKRSSSRPAQSPFREGTGTYKPHLARGDSYHSGLSYELTYDEFKTASTTSTPPLDLLGVSESTERKPRHDPNAAPRITNSSSLNYLRAISRSRSRARNQSASGTVVVSTLGSNQDEIELKNKGKGITGFSEMADLENAVNNALKFMESSDSVNNGAKIGESDDLVKSLNESINNTSASGGTNPGKTDLENVKEEEEVDADETSTTIKDETIDDIKSEIASPVQKKVDPKETPEIVPFKAFATHEVPSDEEFSQIRKHKSFVTEELPSDDTKLTTTEEHPAENEAIKAAPIEVSSINKEVAKEEPTIKLLDNEVTEQEPTPKPLAEEVFKEESIEKLPAEEESIEELPVEQEPVVKLPIKEEITKEIPTEEETEIKSVPVLEEVTKEVSAPIQKDVVNTKKETVVVDDDEVKEPIKEKVEQPAEILAELEAEEPVVEKPSEKDVKKTVKEENKEKAEKEVEKEEPIKKEVEEVKDIKNKVEEEEKETEELKIDEPVKEVGATKELRAAETVQEEATKELKVAETVQEETTKELKVAETVQEETTKELKFVEPVKEEVKSVEPVKEEVKETKREVVANDDEDDDLDAIIAAAEAELADLKKSSKSSNDFDALIAEAEKEQAAKAKSSLSNVTKGANDGSVYVPKQDKMTFEDEPVYIYTSLAGGFQIMTRTNRLTTILTANKIKFEYKDLGTDEEAKKVWRRYSSGKTLPGVVRGKDDFIGNWEVIEEANENYEVRSLIYETY